MSYLGSILWIVPLLIHVAYILATYDHLPAALGPRAGEGIPPKTFFIWWFAIIGLANLAFTFLHVRLPKLKKKSLVVPGQAYWLSTSELKKELVDRLRGIIEAALLGLNVFFLAIYQMIYQTNAVRPVIVISLPMLVSIFMGGALIVVVGSMIITIRGLAKDAPKNAKPLAPN